MGAGRSARSLNRITCITSVRCRPRPRPLTSGPSSRCEAEGGDRRPVHGSRCAAARAPSIYPSWDPLRLTSLTTVGGDHRFTVCFSQSSRSAGRPRRSSQPGRRRRQQTQRAARRNGTTRKQQPLRRPCRPRAGPTMTTAKTPPPSAPPPTSGASARSFTRSSSASRSSPAARRTSQRRFCPAGRSCSRATATRASACLPRPSLSSRCANPSSLPRHLLAPSWVRPSHNISAAPPSV